MINGLYAHEIAAAAHTHTQIPSRPCTPESKKDKPICEPKSSRVFIKLDRLVQNFPEVLVAQIAQTGAFKKFSHSRLLSPYAVGELEMASNQTSLQDEWRDCVQSLSRRHSRRDPAVFQHRTPAKVRIAEVKMAGGGSWTVVSPPTGLEDVGKRRSGRPRSFLEPRWHQQEGMRPTIRAVLA